MITHAEATFLLATERRLELERAADNRRLMVTKRRARRVEPGGARPRIPAERRQAGNLAGCAAPAR